MSLEYRAREQSHHCLIEAVRTLFVEKGLLSVTLLEGFKEAKILREDADYYGRWTKTGSEKLSKTARHFLERAKRLVANE
jgi:uncharacterized protein (UPF0332 family)